MANSSEFLDKWRNYLRSCNTDIFTIIEHAILVAASDYPYDFLVKRDRIAEMLFTCKMTKCFGCEKIELVVPDEFGAEKSDKFNKNGTEAGFSKDTKESQFQSCKNGEQMQMNVNQIGNVTYGEAEALTDEIEKQYELLGEVTRIKESIDNSESQSEASLFDSLRQLQLMPVSVEILKATEVGKSVNALRKHGSKEIRNLSNTLVGDWKTMVDECALSMEAFAGAKGITESVKTSTNEEEEGLPSPPFDEGALFATPAVMELSQFFDGLDDFGLGDVPDPRNCGEFSKNHENGRRPKLVTPSIPKWKNQIPDNPNPPPKDKKCEEKNNQEPVLKIPTPECKPNRPPYTELRTGRPKPPDNEFGPGRTKPALQNKVNNESKVQQKPLKGTIQKKPVPPQLDLKGNDEASVQVRLEAAKRKLYERYQEAEKAKKQRTVQVVELRDLPRHSLTQKNQHLRPRNQNRYRANGRR